MWQKAKQISLWLAIAVGAVALVAVLLALPSRNSDASPSSAAPSAAPSMAVERRFLISPAKPDRLMPDGTYSVKTALAVLRPLVSTLDCEQGGQFQSAEIDDHLNQLFRFYDRDLSGQATLGEYLQDAEGELRAKRQALFKRIDQNKDGTISKKEYRAHLYAMVELVDTDKDAEVTDQELDRDP